MHNYTVIYLKRNGKIFVRYRKTSPLNKYLKIGGTTSMGWKIIDVIYDEGNDFISMAQRQRIVY